MILSLSLSILKLTILNRKTLAKSVTDFRGNEEQAIH